MSVDWFNLTEAGFWFLVAGICFYVSRRVPLDYFKMAFFSALALTTFGMSDLAQLWYGSFLVPGMEWLLVWKVLNVLVLVGIVGWYIYLRLTYSRSMAKSIDTGQ